MGMTIVRLVVLAAATAAGFALGPPLGLSDKNVWLGGVGLLVGVLALTAVLASILLPRTLAEAATAQLAQETRLLMAAVPEPASGLPVMFLIWPHSPLSIAL